MNDTKLDDDQSKMQDSADFLKLLEETGDIFDAPPNTLIIHACNCEGHWGAGIAKAFKDRYPEAYENHEEYCEEHSYSLLDSAQLIPPVDAAENEGDHEQRQNETSNNSAEQTQPPIPKHFVGCLFTSRRYGRRKDSPKRILAATKPAMEDLLKQVNDWNAKAKSEEEKVKEVRMCRVNSGLFAVRWEDSKKVLESIEVSGYDVKTITVVSLADR